MRSIEIIRYHGCEPVYRFILLFNKLKISPKNILNLSSSNNYVNTDNNLFKKGNLQAISENQGFSLIEILVAISIIAVITAVTIPNFRNFNREQELNVAKGLLFDDLRLAKSKADSGVVCPEVKPEVASLQISYSIVLKNSSYITKYDCIDNSRDTPLIYTGSQVKTYPVSTAVKMPVAKNGTQDFCLMTGANDNLTLTYMARSCPVGSATCKGVTISCTSSGVTTTYNSPGPLSLILQNNQSITKTINVSPGGAIYEN